MLGRHAIELPPEVEAQPVAVRALPRPTALSGHAVIVGYGRVGSTVAASLREREQSFVVIEDRPVPMGAAREDDVEIIFGNGADPLVLQAANVAGAQYLFVAIPRSFDAGQIVRQAHAANPALKIIARAHSDAEVTHLQKCGATQTIMGEREIALGMLDLAFTAAATDEPPAPFLTA